MIEKKLIQTKETNKQYPDDKKQHHYHIDLLVSCSKKSTEELWDYLFDELGINDCECTITDVRPASDEEILTWFTLGCKREDLEEMVGKDNKTRVQIIQNKARQCLFSSSEVI